MRNWPSLVRYKRVEIPTLNTDIKQDESVAGIKVLKDYKLRAFTSYLVLILENPLEEIDVLMGKLREFGALAGFKINKEKTKMLGEDMKSKNNCLWKQVFGLRKIKYLGIIITNKICMLFENNFF